MLILEKWFGIILISIAKVNRLNNQLIGLALH